MANFFDTSINGTLNVTGTSSFQNNVFCIGNTEGFRVGNDTYSCALYMGSGGVNRGIYDFTLDKWMIYANASNVYLNGNAETATTATKINSSSVGDTDEPIYLYNGVPTALGSVGGAAKPVYLKAGTFTALGTIGGAAQPVYMSSGEFKPLSSSVGSTNTGIKMNAGTLQSCESAYLLGSTEGWTWGSDWSDGGTDGNLYAYIYRSPMTGICMIRYYGVYTPTAAVSARATILVGTSANYKPGGNAPGRYNRQSTGTYENCIGSVWMNASGEVKMKINAALTANTKYTVSGTIWFRE